MSYKDKERNREYNHARRLRYREQWLADNGPCSNCGSWADLEIDHIDPTYPGRVAKR